MSVGREPQQERRPDRAALAIAIVLALVAIVIAWSTATTGGPAAGGQIGPEAFPYLIAACLFGFSIWTAIEAVRGDFPEREPQALSPMLWIVGGLAAQMLLLKITGFSIATGLLFAATARGFGRGPLWMTIPIGVILAGAIWLVFAQGLSLSLPAGPFEQALITIVGPVVQVIQTIFGGVADFFRSFA